jgi:DNA-binding MarR family transcriptional regulator
MLVSDSAQTADRLRPVLLHLARELRREVHAFDLSGHQISLLSQVERHPGSGVSKLAELERVSKPAISTKVDRLVELKLLERRVADDRRCVGLTVTPAGKNVLKDVRKRRNAWLDQRLEQLSPKARASIAAAIEPLRELLEASA